MEYSPVLTVAIQSIGPVLGSYQPASVATSIRFGENILSGLSGSSSLILNMFDSTKTSPSGTFFAAQSALFLSGVAQISKTHASLGSVTVSVSPQP